MSDNLDPQALIAEAHQAHQVPGSLLDRLTRALEAALTEAPARTNLANGVWSAAQAKGDWSTPTPASTDAREDTVVASFARTWLAHQGYSPEQIKGGEEGTHAAAGCEFESGLGYYQHENENGESLHPLMDAVAEAEEFARFAIDHMAGPTKETIEDLEYGLSLAPMGARCTVEGFREWRATPYGWQNTDTGQLITTGLLAEAIFPTLPVTRDDAKAEALEEAADADSCICPECGEWRERLRARAATYRATSQKGDGQ